MQILVLGAGCTKCDQMKQTVQEVVKELGIDSNVEHTKDINVVMSYSVLTTPGLVINEEVVCSGRVPTKAEVTQFFVNALSKESESNK